MTEWRKVRLGDISQSNISTYSLSESWEFVNYLDTGNITNGTVDQIQFIDLKKENLPSRARRKVSFNDIIYSTVRPNQKHYGRITNNIENLLVSTGFTVITVDPIQADSKFIFYVITQKEYTEKLQTIAEQNVSTYPSIKPSDLEDLIFSLPPLDVQRKIAGILGALDDKIEVLREQNKTLEKMAQAVFQSWFVDFDIVRAKAAGLPTADVCKKYHITSDIYDLFPSAFSADNLPQGWTIGKIKNLCFDIQSGGTPQRNIKEYWCPPTIPWLSSGEVNFPIIIHTKEKISEEGLRNSSAKKWKKYTTVVAMYGATAGEATLLGIDVSANQACCALIPYKYTIYYVYLLAKANKNIYALAANGAAQQNLNKTKVSELEVIIPDAIILTCFQNLISSFFEKIIENSKQIHTLEQTRDTLLSQLICGKLDVENVSLPSVNEEV